MAVVGEVPLTVDRAGFSPLAGAFTPVLTHEHGTHPPAPGAQPVPPAGRQRRADARGKERCRD